MKELITLEREPLQPLSLSQRESNEEAVSQYEQDVTAEAARYLLDRGIEEATALTFRLGVVGEHPAPGHDRFRDWLVIPYLHPSGYPVQLRFRCLQDHRCRDFGHGKYMTIADDPARMFNVGALVEAGDTIHVCEGELDAIILTQLGYHAVALPGAQGFAGHHRRLLAGFSRIHVWGDPDAAGAEFVNKVTKRLRNAKGVYLKAGDVTDTYLTGGPTAIHDLID